MPNVSSSLSHKFTVNTVPKKVLVDTFINIVKRRAEIVYRSSIGARSASISFINNYKKGSKDEKS